MNLVSEQTSSFPEQVNSYLTTVLTVFRRVFSIFASMDPTVGYFRHISSVARVTWALNSSGAWREDLVARRNKPVCVRTFVEEMSSNFQLPSLALDSCCQKVCFLQ